MTQYYKFLKEDGLSTHADHPWPLPTATEPGAWVEVEGELIACRNGLHSCTEKNLVRWMAPHLYRLEYDGEVIDDDEKSFGRRARLVERIDAWNDRTARLFAVDCAEHVARFWVAPEDCTWKPSDTLDVVRRYSEGKATEDELAAAGAAARAAAENAAGYAAWNAAGYAAWNAARAAAWNAARAAAWNAAGAAARAAAGAAVAEYEWQVARLIGTLDIGHGGPDAL